MKFNNRSVLIAGAWKTGNLSQRGTFSMQDTERSFTETLLHLHKIQAISEWFYWVYLLTAVCKDLLETPSIRGEYILIHFKSPENLQRSILVKNMRFGIRQTWIQFSVLYFTWEGSVFSKGVANIRWAQVSTQQYLHFLDEEPKSEKLHNWFQVP